MLLTCLPYVYIWGFYVVINQKISLKRTWCCFEPGRDLHISKKVFIVGGLGYIPLVFLSPDFPPLALAPLPPSPPTFINLRILAVKGGIKKVSSPTIQKITSVN